MGFGNIGVFWSFMRISIVFLSATLSLLSFFSFTLMDAGIQHLLKSLHLFQITFLNNAISLAFMAGALGFLFLRQNYTTQQSQQPQQLTTSGNPTDKTTGLIKDFLVLRPKKWKWLVINAIGAVIGDLLVFAALDYHSLGEIYVIILVTPIFACVLAYFFYGEKIIPLKWLCIFIAFVASIFALNFSYGGFSWALFGVLVSAFIYGGGYILIKYYLHEESIPVIFVTSRVGAMLILAVPTFFVSKAISPGEWGLLIANGFGFFAAFMFIVIATRIGEVSTVSSLQYMQLLFGILVDIWFYQIYPGPVSLIAGTCIIGSGLLIIYLDRQREKLILPSPHGL